MSRFNSPMFSEMSGSCFSVLIVQHLLLTAQIYKQLPKLASFSGIIFLSRAFCAEPTTVLSPPRRRGSFLRDVLKGFLQEFPEGSDGSDESTLCSRVR